MKKINLNNPCEKEIYKLVEEIYKFSPVFFEKISK